MSALVSPIAMVVMVCMTIVRGSLLLLGAVSRQQESSQQLLNISLGKVTAIIIRNKICKNKENYQKVSTRSLYITNTGRASKAEACKKNGNDG
jgi:hypothetical protein